VPVPMLMALDSMEGVPMLTAPDSMEGVPILAAPDLVEGMPMSTTPDPNAGPVEVGRRLVPAEDDFYLCPCTIPKVMMARARNPSDDKSRCASTCLWVLGSGEERRLNLASYYVLAATSLSLSTPGSNASPLLKDRSTTRSNELLATPGESAPSCLLRSSTTHPMATNASIIQLSESSATSTTSIRTSRIPRSNGTGAVSTRLMTERIRSMI
jgi:hypothetical protein